MAAVLAFYDVFLPRLNFLKMRICDAFVAKLRGGMLPKRVLLRNRCEEEFDVEVLKEDGKVFFCKGWQEFVEKNGLLSGYFLIFRYDGVRTFDVIIYNYFGCEIECIQDDRNGCFGEDDPDWEEDEDEEEEAEDYSDAEYDTPQPRVPNTSKRGTDERDNASRKRPYHKHDWADSDAELLVKPGSFYFVAKRASRKRENQLLVPNTLLRDFKIELDDKIIYQDPSGREYIGRVSKWQTGQKWISGWKTFIKANTLSDTDKCVFELEIGEGGKCSYMLVHIIRKP